MPKLFLACGLVTLGATPGILDLMQQAFYPSLLGILVIASLGIPIPEDLPLIAAGVLINLRPDIASWPMTMLVALIGIMSGDLILYTLGRRWGRGVMGHRSVNWLITPALFEKAVANFHRRGMWYCFFGRFLMGVRAVMCMTAGATHFPYWKFFIADFAGALLSVPFFIYLGYAFGGMIPQLRKHMAEVQGVVIAVVVLLIAAYIYFEVRKHRRMHAESERAALAEKSLEHGPADAADRPNPSTARPVNEPNPRPAAAPTRPLPSGEVFPG